MEKMIAVLGGDRRMALLARLLAEDGHPVRTWGLAAFGMEDTALEAAAQADRVVLPVPLSRGKNLNCTATALPLCGLFALLRPEQRLYAGGVKAADREAAAEFGLTLTDYLSREELAVRNGVPTAEGAIEAAMAATDVTLCGTPCLVIGFGRIGKLLAHRLRGWARRSRSAHGGWTISRGSTPSATAVFARTVSPDGSGASASSSTPCRTWYSQRNCCAICRASACCSSWPRSPASTVRRRRRAG
ncbi:MAG: dipicolinate synthase subunit DpsA [Oscillospiraceae bacterium]